MTARAADEADPSHESEVIEAAGKRPQPVAEVASPVTLITADEIHAHGFHTLGEALQWVRGMYVTSDRVYSYLGIRGIQRPGDFNNKVLLALDGHVMNGNVFGDATWMRRSASTSTSSSASRSSMVRPRICTATTRSWRS